MSIHIIMVHHKWAKLSTFTCYVYYALALAATSNDLEQLGWFYSLCAIYAFKILICNWVLDWSIVIFKYLRSTSIEYMGKSSFIITWTILLLWLSFLQKTRAVDIRVWAVHHFLVWFYRLVWDWRQGCFWS